MGGKTEYPFEPFVFKSVRQIPILTKKDRREILKEAHYNLFFIPADKVTIDLLTDSGTGALSEEQWSSLMRGDESYAQAVSWKRLEKSARCFSGMRYILPVHQGRAAEKLIAEAFVRSGDVVVANTLFDTTRANFEHRGAVCVDLPTQKADNPSTTTAFKGDMEIAYLKRALEIHGERVKLIVMTLTNNSGGGQPASLANVREVAKIARERNILFLIDACRIVENAYFIWRDEYGRSLSLSQVVKDTFALADLAFMSAKKDGLANIGGFIFTNKRKIAQKLGELVILYEGYLTYGGMSGREMETITQGLKEVIELSYLEHRIGQVAYLHERLAEIGIPLIHPPGGHAVYIDAGALLPHIPASEFPGQALVAALYEEGGVRAVEIGSLMFGEHAKHEFVRLALPRRTYAQSHLDYVVEIFQRVLAKKDSLRGFEIVWQPNALRHFSCKLKPLSN